MRSPSFERSGSLWVPSRREMLRALGVGLLAPCLARAATYSLVATSAIANAVSSTLTSSPINTTGADLLVAVVGSDYAQPTIDFISDSNGNTWTPLTQQNGWARSRMFWCRPSVVGANHTVTFGWPGTISCYVVAFSGSTSSPFEAESGATNATPTVSPGSLTPALTNELVVSGFATNGTSTVPAVDASMTILGASAQTAGMALGLAYKIQVAAAPINPVWTYAGSGVLGAVMATFKSSSSAAGGAPTARHRVIGGG